MSGTEEALAWPEHPAAIQDYALLGDGRSAALVSRFGSIDWLAWPRFDAPSIFAAILDPRAGYWRIAPTKPSRTERHYVPDTNVLKTRFDTGRGIASVLDLMVVASEADKNGLLLPEHALIRRVTCEQGAVQLESVFEPRPDYARVLPKLVDDGPLGVRVESDGALYTLRGTAPHTIDMTAVRARARFSLTQGESADFVLSFDADSPVVLMPLAEVGEAVARAIAYWQRWAARARYDGPYRALVVRSALTLKLLSYAPSGAVVAAPTTSLPESLGGSLNWDYRFCWLRDASLTVRALLGLGYSEEATAFVSWLLQTTRLTRPKLRVLYDVFGGNPRREEILTHLAGYRGSTPVRICNAAAKQVQLDVYGEVIDAVSQVLGDGNSVDRDTQKMLRDFGSFVCKHAGEGDSGIWEVRGATRHYTHSRVLCWTALDRLLDMHARGVIAGLPVSELTAKRGALRREIEARGYNRRLGTFTQVLDGDTVDASLLLLSWYGFVAPEDPRMRGTYREVHERLRAGPGLLYRNEASALCGEGAFGICSYWAVEHLAAGGGTLAEARRYFNEASSHANDVGLFAEETAPGTREAIGNFPQAYTHVGLIGAALAIAARERREVRDPVRTSRSTPCQERAAHP